MTTKDNKRNSLDYSENPKGEKSATPKSNGSDNKPSSPPPPSLGKNNDVLSLTHCLHGLF